MISLPCPLPRRGPFCSLSYDCSEASKGVRQARCCSYDCCRLRWPHHGVLLARCLTGPQDFLHGYSVHRHLRWDALLGGRFGPPKIFSPPPPTPQMPQFTADTLPAPPPPSTPPRPGIFNSKPIPPLPGASDSPFPLPDQQNRKYSKRQPSLLLDGKGRLWEGLVDVLDAWLAGRP